MSMTKGTYDPTLDVVHSHSILYEAMRNIRQALVLGEPSPKIIAFIDDTLRVAGLTTDGGGEPTLVDALQKIAVTHKGYPNGSTEGQIAIAALKAAGIRLSYEADATQDRGGEHG
jgi:hypothetical protein